MIAINYTNQVGQIIRNILKAHRKEGLQPALNYSKPEIYELRLHEGKSYGVLESVIWLGDGLPDEDFALEPDKQLAEYGKETEYCLCDISDDDFVQAKLISTGDDESGRESDVSGMGPSERVCDPVYDLVSF